jgi:hypothetical protein
MPYFLLFAAGLIVGRSWTKFKDVLKPIVGDAGEKFDKLYSQSAKKVTQRFEDFEDSLAEKRYRNATIKVNNFSNRDGKQAEQ